MLQSEAYDGDKEQRKQGYPRHSEVSGQSLVRPRLDRVGPELLAWVWCAVGNARAVNCPGVFLGGEVCERRLVGESAHFRAGRC